MKKWGSIVVSIAFVAMILSGIAMIFENFESGNGILLATGLGNITAPKIQSYDRDASTNFVVQTPAKPNTTSDSASGTQVHDTNILIDQNESYSGAGGGEHVSIPQSPSAPSREIDFQANVDSYAILKIRSDPDGMVLVDNLDSSPLDTDIMPARLENDMQKGENPKSQENNPIVGSLPLGSNYSPSNGIVSDGLTEGDSILLDSRSPIKRKERSRKNRLHISISKLQ